MSYMQESIVNSIHQERHREADVERLSGPSRLPKRQRRYTFSLPHFPHRTPRPPGSTVPGPAA
jgi:hypothetical protein